MKPTLRELTDVVYSVYRDPSGIGPFVWKRADGSYQTRVPAYLAEKVQNRIEYNFPDADVRIQ